MIVGLLMFCSAVMTWDFGGPVRGVIDWHVAAGGEPSRQYVQGAKDSGRALQKVALLLCLLTGGMAVLAWRRADRAPTTPESN
jgi:hypothetical protein